MGLSLICLHLRDLGRDLLGINLLTHLIDLVYSVLGLRYFIFFFLDGSKCQLFWLCKAIIVKTIAAHAEAAGVLHVLVIKTHIIVLSEGLWDAGLFCSMEGTKKLIKTCSKTYDLG